MNKIFNWFKQVLMPNRKTPFNPNIISVKIMRQDALGLLWENSLNGEDARRWGELICNGTFYKPEIGKGLSDLKWNIKQINSEIT